MEQSIQQVDLRLDLGAAQRHIIRRPRLTKLLDEAEGRIVLLVAPAGYGKTELAREWTSLRNRRGLWYRARAGASDVAVVARLLSRALAPLSPTVERSTRELLSALNTPEDEPEAVAYLLAEELEAWPAATWLVIDEYELVVPHAAPVKLIEHFVQLSGASVLITSRERPSWITPRDLLYGEGFELGAAALSMTVEEATQVLESAPHPPAGLVALADGWPAVIGLAALLPHQAQPTSDVQSALFDYVAQELFDALEPDVQRHLVLLSMPSTLKPELVQSLLGQAAEGVLRASISVGLMTSRGGGQDLEIHPLCRVFLQRKVWDIGVARAQLDALVLCLLDAAQWDDAFELIRRFDLAERLPTLVERGLRQTLGEGRLAAVEAWVAWADGEHLDSPELALARAEIYLRRGHFGLSASLAATCAQVTRSPELAAQAHLCAGAAAHLVDQADRARDHYGRALTSHASAEVRRRALWGRFVASYWTKRPDYLDDLATLESAVDPSPDHLLRLGQARLIVAERQGSVSAAVAGALAVEPLLEHVEDPFLRSGFLNTLTRALTLVSQYAEAEIVATRQLKEAQRFRLSFALPAALINLAQARLGLGAFTTASALIERSQREDATNDPVYRVKREIVLAAIALSRGASEVAVDELNATSFEGARADMVSEGLALRALAEACCKETDSARRSMAAAAELGGDVASRVLRVATAAVVSLADSELELAANLKSLAFAASDTGCFDSVICALRASPELLSASTRHDAMREVIRIAATRSGDAALAASVGSPIRTRREQTLSRREREVLQLVAEGFRNDEIGRRLFISPKTVKTHLQNVYEKLHVNSRTEAAIKAKDAGLLS